MEAIELARDTGGINEVKALTLNDMTKEELIRLIERSAITCITQRDLLYTRWKTLKDKSQHMMDEACSEMEAAKGPEKINKWMAANKKFDEAENINKQADKVFENMMISHGEVKR